MPKFTLSAPNKIRGDQLADEIGKALGTYVPAIEITLRPPLDVAISGIPWDDEREREFIVQALIDVHEPDSLYFAADRERMQSETAQGNLRQYLKGLRQLPPQDAAYALLGRAFAANDGAGNATVQGISDRASAVAYITAKPEWGDLPASARQWAADELGALAIILQALIVVIT